MGLYSFVRGTNQIITDYESVSISFSVYL
jgi:hypothetical protein